MRYFVKMSRGVPFNLYRFDIINEERWYPTQGWTPTRVISAYLVMAEGDYEEITESLARESFPDAFALAKSIGAYEVSKAEEAKRYTLGAMYIPDRIDAHGEWTDSDELQRAVWDYVKSNDRRIRLQHNRDVVAGEWVEVMAFPYELTVPIQTMSGIDVNHTYPPNTVFLGVIWEPWAWDLVKTGKILGYSIGGKAERLYVDMEEVEKEDGPGVNDVHVDTIMNPKKKETEGKVMGIIVNDGDSKPVNLTDYSVSFEKAKSVKSGDMVSWNSSGGKAQGKVVRVVSSGKINVPDSSFSIAGTEDDPAVLIQLYRDGKPTETKVGHKMSTLKKNSEVAKHGSHDQGSHGAWANGKYNPDDSEGEDESEPKNSKNPKKLHSHDDDSEEEYEELDADDPRWMDDMDIMRPSRITPSQRYTN